MSSAPKHFEGASRPDGARLAASLSRQFEVGPQPEQGTERSAPVLSVVHQFSAMENIVFGRPIAEVLPMELQRRELSRVFLVTNNSLSNAPIFKTILASLEGRLAGVYNGVVAHAPRMSVIEGAIAARSSRADLILAVGGGSVIDVGKVMLLALRHGYVATSQLAAHANGRLDAAYMGTEEAAKWLRLIAVPTTFSAAEYTPFAGITEPVTKAKQGFSGAMMMPLVVINDPEMIRETPSRLLWSTGIKAVDHAVESITSRRATPYVMRYRFLVSRCFHVG